MADTRNTVDVDLERWFGDAEIPYLEPYGCAHIPGYRLLPDGSEDESWRTEWFETRDRIMEVRERIWEECERSVVRQAEERILALTCPHYFKAIFGWIGEPRPRKGELAHKPFIPFHYQIHLTTLRRDLVYGPEAEIERDMWFPKARGLGVSWNNQHDEVYDWLSRDSRWILSSRNEDLVGDIDNVDAMFGKIFYVLRRLPRWLLPVGFDPEAPRGWWNSTKMTLTNKDKDSPGYGSQLVGSPTTKNIGRAGRYTGADVDEGQEVPRINKVIQSLRGSTFHVLVTGTEGTNEGEEFVEGWTSAKRENPYNVVELNYHQNAYQDRMWLERQYARATTPEQKAGVALEYERNYFAGYGDWIYPEAHTIAETDQPYDPRLMLAVMIDPGKDDETAVLVAQPNGLGFHVLFTYEVKLTNMEWICHVLTGIWPARWKDEHGAWQKDPCYGMEPSPEERAIGAFFHQRWLDGVETFWGMDPAGVMTQSTTSFWSMFESGTGRLRAREVQALAMQRKAALSNGADPAKLPPLPALWGITLMYLALQKNRGHADRHYALRSCIHYITIQAGVSSARRGKTCLMRYQFNPRTPKAVTEAVPLANQYQHLASCFEYLAQYLAMGFVEPLAAVDATGKKVTTVHLPTPGQTKLPPRFVPKMPPRGGSVLVTPPGERGYRMPPGSRFATRRP